MINCYLVTKSKSRKILLLKKSSSQELVLKSPQIEAFEKRGKDQSSRLCTYLPYLISRRS